MSKKASQSTQEVYKERFNVSSKNKEGNKKHHPLKHKHSSTNPQNLQSKRD